MNVNNVHGRLGRQLYVVIYGVLRRPRDTVVARAGARRLTVHRVALPARLHGRGAVLVYTVVHAHSRRIHFTITAYTATGAIDSRKYCIGIGGGCWSSSREAARATEPERASTRVLNHMILPDRGGPSSRMGAASGNGTSAARWLARGPAYA
jgi:hypothetical protein